MTVLNEFTFLNGVTAPCYSKELLNNAAGGLVLAVSDGFDGSITVQGKQNGEWYTLGVVDLAKAGAADAITAAGSYSVIGVAGFSRIRLNLTAVSGTATVSGRLTTEPGTILAASSSESGGGGGFDVIFTKPQSGTTYTCNHTHAEMLDAIYNNMPISVCVIDLASSLVYDEKTYHPRYIGYTKITMASNGQLTFEIFTPSITSSVTTDYIMVSRFNVTVTTSNTITGSDNSYMLSRYKFS